MPITVTTVYSKERLMNFVFFNARRKVWFWLLMAASLQNTSRCYETRTSRRKSCSTSRYFN